LSRDIWLKKLKIGLEGFDEAAEELGFGLYHLQVML
jgi:hypothetical protein